MKKTSLTFIACALGTLTLGACTPKVDTAKASYCSAVNNYAVAVNNLNSLPSTATVADYNKLQSQVNQTGNALDSAARTLDKSEGKALSSTSKQFEAEVNKIKSTETLADAQVKIKSASDLAIAQSLKITETDCSIGADAKAK
jgi:hypothetical protein